MVLVATAGAGGIGWVIFNDLVAVTNDLPQYEDNIDKKIAALNAPGNRSSFIRIPSLKQGSRG